MSSPSTFNRQAIGKLWNLIDLPVEWPGYQILLKGDLDQDLVIEEEELDEIDWIAFSEAVGDFQLKAGVELQDSKLGKDTIKKLRKFYGLSPAGPDVLKRLGDLEFKPTDVPVSEPPGPPLLGSNLEEKTICRLWNKYGGAINLQARAYQIPVETALAVFAVESSGRAYDPDTGLVIIRFEPHIFKRKSGVEVGFRRDGQKAEWQNLEQAYEVEAEAALLSCSYGLPQLMGFNWQVTKHASVREMVLAFQRSCEEQVAGFFGFVAKNNLVPFIKEGNWQAFTRYYNGPGNVPEYSGKLMRFLKVVNALKEDGANFTG